MTISIALATFNGVEFIGELPESLPLQDLQALQVVVCDDRSTDDTVRPAEEFSRGAPFSIKVQVNKQRLGYRSQFMKAAGLCSGASQ